MHMKRKRVGANNAREFFRAWWINAQLKAPPLAQRTVIPRLHEAKEIGRLLVKPYLPIYQLQGQGQGGPLTVTYVGLEFTKPFLIDLLFVEKPAEQQVGRIPFWRCNELTDLSSSDIIIVEAAKHLIRRLPGRNTIVFPQLVGHVLDLQGSWEDVKSRFHKSVRYELRLTRKHDYHYEISYDDRDFEAFYNDMYLPTMTSRHGDLASPTPIDEAYRYFKHGFLFFVTREGRRVCGSLCYVEQDVLQFVILGVLNADEQMMKEGVIGALNILRIQWANQHGYAAVDFLGSGARLNGGLFQHKRKWGTTVSIPSNLHRLIWLRIRHNTPAVSQFLKENPFIVADEHGKLHGLIIVDDPHSVSTETKQEWEARFATPGLGSLIIRSIHSFIEEPGSSNIPDLVIPLSPRVSSGAS